MSVAIKISHAVKKYGNNTVIPDLSLDIREGEFFTLLGPSGCGKTTLLRMIAGFNSIEGGDFYFNEKRINDVEPNKRNIGMVFQNYAIFPHLTVRQNVGFGLKNRKCSKEEMESRTDEYLKLMQIEEYKDRLPERLSGGQQQRVALARALVIHPDVLLMDEPLSNLDAKLRVEMRSAIKDIQNQVGITTVYVTHDQEEAMAIADRIAILDNGRIQQFDTPFELYQHPVNLFVANFMGNPPMNFIDAELAAENGSVCFKVAGQTIPVPESAREPLKKYAGRGVKIGVRSHQITPVKEGTPDAIRLTVQMVENLGKELLVQAQVGDNLVRISEEDTRRYEHYRELAASGGGMGILLTDHLNVFDRESGLNLLIRREGEEA